MGELKEVRCSQSLTGSLLDELLEDFTSGGFNLDLMDDDGPAFTSDPVFSSPQVSSPNSSHHSFDDALTPDSMDIATWLWMCVVGEPIFFMYIWRLVSFCSFSWSCIMCTYEAFYCFSSVLFVISNLLPNKRFYYCIESSNLLCLFVRIYFVVTWYFYEWFTSAYYKIFLWISALIPRNYLFN